MRMRRGTMHKPAGYTTYQFSLHRSPIYARSHSRADLFSFIMLCFSYWALWPSIFSCTSINQSSLFSATRYAPLTNETCCGAYIAVFHVVLPMLFGGILKCGARKGHSGDTRDVGPPEAGVDVRPWGLWVRLSLLLLWRPRQVVTQSRRLPNGEFKAATRCHRAPVTL